MIDTKRERSEEIRDRETRMAYDNQLMEKADVIPSMAASIIAPTTRIQWGAIFAGLFASVTTLVVLSVLGLAVGLSSYDAGDPLQNFGMGAGIWSAVSTLIAFIVGGWLAAYSATTGKRRYGILNSAMVWIVAIPLLLYGLGSGLGSLISTAGSIAATGATLAGEAVGTVADTSAVVVPQATVEAGAAGVVGAAQATVEAVGEQITPQNVENVTATASTTAWSTLLALLIGLGAAILGGFMGWRPLSMPTYMPALS